MLKIINMILGGVFLAFSAIISAKLILKENIKISKVFCFIIVIMISLFYTINYYLNDGIVKSILNLLLNILSFKYIFKLSYSRSILLTFVYAILLLFPDMIIMFVSLYILNISPDYYYNVFAGSLFANILGSIMLIVITYILRKPLNKLMNVKLEESKKIIIYSILSFICIAIFFYNAFSNLQFTENKILNMAIMFFLIIVIFNLFYQIVKNKMIKTKYDKILNFMREYETVIETERMKRHEVKNQFITVKCKISDGDDQKEIFDYLDLAIKDYNIKINYEKYSKCGYLPSNGLRALFYYKIAEAEDKNLNISLNVSKQIKNSFLFKINTKYFNLLVKILCIYIDNAIEASAISNDKLLGLEVYNLDDDIEFIISNSYNDLNINQVGENNYTTKGIGHGYGLKIVEGILFNNKIFSQEKSVINNIYIQKLKIKKPLNNN